MKSPVDAYESVSVDSIEQILGFMHEAWLHGFPVVRKEDGRSERQLRLHAALLLLTVTGCLSREQIDNSGTIPEIKEALEGNTRLANDVGFFLEKTRSPDRYTREAIAKRKNR